MRTIAVIFALALIAIAAGIYSDIVLTREEVARTQAGDPRDPGSLLGFRGAAVADPPGP